MKLMIDIIATVIFIYLLINEIINYNGDLIFIIILLIYLVLSLPGNIKSIRKKINKK